MVACVPPVLRGNINPPTDQTLACNAPLENIQHQVLQRRDLHAMRVASIHTHRPINPSVFLVQQTASQPWPAMSKQIASVPLDIQVQTAVYAWHATLVNIRTSRGLFLAEPAAAAFTAIQWAFLPAHLVCLGPARRREVMTQAGVHVSQGILAPVVDPA